jgi:membrane-anchored protein YejM (alkaline phosphatase superfamily)
MGYQPVASSKKMATGKVQYPFRPLTHKKVGNPLNIVWLVAESLRADMLTPEIMPNVWEYSEKNIRFNHHYSGGNRTRMGLFSMFYGLYAPYWYSFEEQKISSPIIDTLMSQNYQLQINTSQSFSYPELNHTVFVNVPREYMQELNDDPVTWKRDEKNITDIMKFLDKRDSNRPFFNFMFFEATHAPYQFPDSNTIRDDYITEMNYAKLNLGTGISQIKNRYINAAHSVDKQIGRLLIYLEDNNLTDNTIVIITGDHGEEFMEKGHWGHGHNAVFPEEQIRVPMVLAIPGMTSKEVNYTTSHLDIPATILPMLGVVSIPEDYSFGHSLLAKTRDSFVVGNYNYISYIDPDYKLTFPYTGKTAFQVTVQKADDNLVTRAERNLVYSKYQNTIDNLFRDTSKFIL